MSVEPKEIRYSEIEYRDENSELVLEGYPIVWDTETLIGDTEHGYYESIAKGSLSAAALKDVPLKYNHMDRAYILARTRNKSLELTQDDKGLHMIARLQSDVQAHRDIYSMVKSGLIDKMSFSFNTIDQKIDFERKLPSRKVIKIGKLFDVSVVDTPAYDQSSVYARSLELVETSRKAALESVRSSMEIELELERLKNKNILKGI